MLARTRSEAALPLSGARSPLASLGREAALSAIVEYLSSEGLRRGTACSCLSRTGVTSCLLIARAREHHTSLLVRHASLQLRT